MLTCCIQALRPHSNFSNGADPSFLAGLVASHPNWSILEQVAIALGEARD